MYNKINVTFKWFIFLMWKVVNNDRENIRKKYLDPLDITLLIDTNAPQIRQYDCNWWL